jgi:hypothetical protein
MTEIERLQDAKRRALAIADERAKENVRLRAERDALVKALEGIAEYCSGDDTTLGALHRLASIRNTAINVLAAVGSAPGSTAPDVSIPAQRPRE